jgi:hypothetical protein
VTSAAGLSAKTPMPAQAQVRRADQRQPRKDRIQATPPAEGGHFRGAEEQRTNIFGRDRSAFDLDLGRFRFFRLGQRDGQDPIFTDRIDFAGIDVGPQIQVALELAV